MVSQPLGCCFLTLILRWPYSVTSHKFLILYYLFLLSLSNCSLIAPCFVSHIFLVAFPHSIAVWNSPSSLASGLGRINLMTVWFLRPVAFMLRWWDMPRSRWWKENSGARNWEPRRWASRGRCPSSRHWWHWHRHWHWHGHSCGGGCNEQGLNSIGRRQNSGIGDYTLFQSWWSTSKVWWHKR